MKNSARFVLSKSKLLGRYKKVNDIADIVSYSWKTNPQVGEVLENNTACWFSVHFMRSLDFIKDKGRVLFLAQGWNNDDLDELFKQGVQSFVVDNEKDLNILLDYIQSRDVKVNLFLRMRMKETTIKTEKYFVYGFYSRQINELVPKLRPNPKIGHLGVHFHKKTQNISEWSFKKELDEILSKDTLGLLDMVNIGGGMPVRYKNYDVDATPYVFEEIKELKRWLNKHNIKMIMEPGRFLAGPCIKLEAEIIGIHENNIIVNCSIYNSALDTLIIPIRLFVEGELDKGTAYTIKGFTPDTMDIFRYKVYLNNPKVGDKIVFLNAGAYNFTTDFCNLEKLETVVVE